MADDGTTGREPWIAGAAILTFQPQRAIQDKALSPRRISENAMAFGTPAPWSPRSRAPRPCTSAWAS